MVRRASRLRRAGYVGAVIASVLVAAVPAAADLQDRREEIRRRQDKVARTLEALGEARSDVEERIASTDARIAVRQREVEGLDSRLAALDADIDRLETELVRAQQRLTVLTQQLQRIVADLHVQRDVFTERAIAAYKAGPAAYVEGLLDSDSFGDLVSRYEYYDSAMDADAELVEDIEVLQAEVDARAALVDAKQTQIAAAKRRLEDQRREVAIVRSERADALARLETVLAGKQTLLAKIESDERRYETIQEQLEADSREIEALLAARAAAAQTAGAPAAPVQASGGGELLWPAAGPVTSGYGYRTHPIFGDQRLHAGIDIGGAYGARVIAADTGTVVFAGAMSGYGNAVVIDHGGGLATTYNHLSAFSVGSGEDVGRGVPIGAVGCTGYCTGPHLHFEVRVDGAPVDPMPYLR